MIKECPVLYNKNKKSERVKVYYIKKTSLLLSSSLAHNNRLFQFANQLILLHYGGRLVLYDRVLFIDEIDDFFLFDLILILHELYLLFELFDSLF